MVCLTGCSPLGLFLNKHPRSRFPWSLGSFTFAQYASGGIFGCNYTPPYKHYNGVSVFFAPPPKQSGRKWTLAIDAGATPLSCDPLISPSLPKHPSPGVAEEEDGRGMNSQLGDTREVFLRRKLEVNPRIPQGIYTVLYKGFSKKWPVVLSRWWRLRDLNNTIGRFTISPLLKKSCILYNTLRCKSTRFSQFSPKRRLFYCPLVSEFASNKDFFGGRGVEQKRT